MKLMMAQKNSGMMESLHGDCVSSILPRRVIINAYRAVLDVYLLTSHTYTHQDKQQVLKQF